MTTITIQFEPTGARKCGTCSLCCKLLPMPELHKPAGVRCGHQRSTGCRIYDKRPASCAHWNCRWLIGDDTADLSRPDRSHYVVDVMPDYITATDNATGARHTVPVVQVWVDPHYRDAHRDPALRAYLERRGAEGYAAIIRYNATDAFVLAPPQMSGTGKFLEVPTSGMREQTHDVADIIRKISGVAPP